MEGGDERETGTEGDRESESYREEEWMRNISSSLHLNSSVTQVMVALRAPEREALGSVNEEVRNSLHRNRWEGRMGKGRVVRRKSGIKKIKKNIKETVKAYNKGELGGRGEEGSES